MAPLDLSMPRSRLPLLLLLLLAVRPSEEQLVSVQTETVAVGSASTSSSSPIEYLLEIQVQTSDLVEVRNLQNTLKLPTALSNTSDITGLNITTVCALVADSFQCECESTFFWPLDSCQRYGSCGQPEATCTCLTSLPANGLFCQPRFEWLYEVELGIPGSLAMAAASQAVARPIIRGISVSGSQLSQFCF
ncbi:adhesion G protein-coupled receptor F5-like [Gadus chalcogrammus]|uniref:adhesion G protein-coupled receptor F5-like n=1 Tax=Gadus chalcogrammus TaxID=1042646 RepID=UPI0024C4950D|nr:adhesion G protein-coupled receptor F5-like [Gadus chalcogrammus]